MADEFVLPGEQVVTVTTQVVTVSDQLVTASDAKKRAFLLAFTEGGNVSAAARIAGVGRRTHYDWLKADKEYKAAFEAAQEDAADALEEEARRRAMGLGYVFDDDGKITGTRPGAKASDLLMIFLLKGLRPEKYAHQHVVAGKGKGGAILLEHIVAGVLTDDEKAGTVVDGELA